MFLNKEKIDIEMNENSNINEVLKEYELMKENF